MGSDEFAELDTTEEEFDQAMAAPRFSCNIAELLDIPLDCPGVYHFPACRHDHDGGSED